MGPDRYLKANVSWHNMLPRPATTKQWSTYNAFIESEASSGSSSTEAYSQAGHQLLLDIFGWEVFPDWGPYSYYIDAGAPGHRPGTTNGRPPTPGKNASTNQAP